MIIPSSINQHRRSRVGGNPVTSDVKTNTTLGPRLRGDDEKCFALWGS